MAGFGNFQFMKKLILLSLIILTSCQNWFEEETKKTGKASSASSRINSSDENSKSIFKELNQ
jgi:hypothetical protein